MIHYTPNFQLGYIDADTALADLAAASADLAVKADAALTRGGVAPPAAQDLVTLSGRVSTLEGSALTTATAILAPKNSFTAASGYQSPTVTRTGKSVTVYALVTGGTGPSGVAVTLPAGYRPPNDLFLGTLNQSSGTNSVGTAIVRASTGNIEFYGPATALQLLSTTFTAA